MPRHTNKWVDAVVAKVDYEQNELVMIAITTPSAFTYLPVDRCAERCAIEYVNMLLSDFLHRHNYTPV